MPGILLGTLVLVILERILVLPIVNALVSRRMAAEGLSAAGFDRLPAQIQETWKSTVISYYILIDVLVLGAAGLIGGLMGYWFVGFSTQLKGWPGMLAFIGCSFLGMAIAGAK